MGETPENANNEGSSAFVWWGNLERSNPFILWILENGATDRLSQSENYSPPSPGQDQISASVAAAQIQSISVSFLF